MSDEETVTEEQEEKYFESRGEEAPETPEPEAGEPGAIESETPKSEAPEEPKEEPKTVPLAALHEARAENKEYRQELSETREKMARMEALFDQMVKKQEQPEEQQVPTFEDDPAGYLRWQDEQNARKIEEIGKKVETSDEHQKALTEHNNFVASLQADETAFRTQTPDYDDASSFLSQQRMQELEMMGLPPEERQRALLAEVRFIHDRAKEQGRSPAEVFYGLAKGRGWQPKKPEANEAEEKIARQQKAAALSDPGGGDTNSADLTLERLAELDGEEFDQAWEKLQRKGMI